MGRAELSSQTCTLARAVAQVGDEWTILILRELFLGNRRFDEILRQTEMSSHLLSHRLKKLEAAGILGRRAYSQRPLRHEYRLTEMGRTLWPVVISLNQWGDDWLNDDEAPVRLVHNGCGQVTQPEMTCPECGQSMTAHDCTAHLSSSFAAERRARSNQTASKPKAPIERMHGQ